MHLKRQEIPINWPIPRKGTTYVARPEFDMERSIPVSVALRDMLKIAANRKEVKRIIHEKNILLNNRHVSDEKGAILLFDTLSFAPLKKHYRLDLMQSGKFGFTEISEKEVNHKIAKIVDKRMLKGKRVQINLSDGRNVISDLKCNTGDSVVVDFKNKKIERCIQFKEGAEAFVFAGKHAGEKGKIKTIDNMKKTADLEIAGKSVAVLIKQIMVIA